MPMTDIKKKWGSHILLLKNVVPDLDPNRVALLVFLKEFFEKVYFEKSQQTRTIARQITQHAKS